MADPQDIVDISSLPASQGGTQKPNASGRPTSTGGRRWLAIKWTCCSAYSRIYPNRAGDAYEGRCPKCARAVRVPIGPGGTNQRFFEAGEM
jgi:hypothetical protein